MKKDSGKWYVYIIRCREGELYTGISTDVNRRFREHESQGSKSAKYLRGRAPLKLLTYKSFAGRSEAAVIEAKIKKLSKREKERLILKEKFNFS